MADYTITLKKKKKTAMEYIAADVDEWITNTAQNRARIAVDEIIVMNAKHCNENSIAIAVGKDAQVAQALSLGVIDKAADRPEPEIPE